MEPVWLGVAEMLLLLAASSALGAVFGRLGQTAILGFLVAGILVGPHGLPRGGEGSRSRSLSSPQPPE